MYISFKSFKFILISFFIIAINCKNKSQTNGPSKAILKTSKKDIIIKSIDKKTLWDFNYVYGQDEVNSGVLKYLVLDLLSKKYNDKILSVDLYINYNNKNTKIWNIYKNDIKNVGIYFLEDNKIKFDYFELPKANTIFNSDKISDIYCDAIIPFLFSNPNLKKEKLSLITFVLNAFEMPNFKTLNLATKENDTVYKMLKDSVDKYKSP